MEKYSVIFKPSAYKTLRKFPNKDIKAIVAKINQLQKNPRPAGCKKLIGTDYYRLRCGHYRVLYSIEDDMLLIWIVKIGHRKGIYR